MRAACAVIGFCLAGQAMFAEEALSVREYSERCARYYAQMYGVSPALVRAIIQIESGWQPGAVSPKGAMGLMLGNPGDCERHSGLKPNTIPG